MKNNTGTSKRSSYNNDVSVKLNGHGSSGESSPLNSEAFIPLTFKQQRKTLAKRKRYEPVSMERSVNVSNTVSENSLASISTKRRRGRPRKIQINQQQQDSEYNEVNHDSLSPELVITLPKLQQLTLNQINTNRYKDESGGIIWRYKPLHFRVLKETGLLLSLALTDENNVSIIPESQCNKTFATSNLHKAVGKILPKHQILTNDIRYLLEPKFKFSSELIKTQHDTGTYNYKFLKLPVTSFRDGKESNIQKELTSPPSLVIPEHNKYQVLGDNALRHELRRQQLLRLKLQQQKTELDSLEADWQKNDGYWLQRQCNNAIDNNNDDNMCNVIDNQNST